MIGYPIDSHVTFNSQGIPSYDRAISSEPLRKLIKSLFSDGVLPNPSTNMQVQAGEGMTVIVNPGFAICNGCMKLEEKARTLVVQASSTSLDRIDTVILRLNNNEDVRSLDFYVLQGTPATNPVRPSLTQNDTIWEIGLADIFIASNTSVITNQRITDTRYETARCGIISSISEFDTTTLYQQVQADLDEFKDVSEADFTAWITLTKADFDNWMDTEKSDFDAWFKTIQSQLSGNVAANLQAQIGYLPSLETQDKSDLVSAINELVTKLPKSVPTTADEGKAPVVQSDGTVDWQKVSGSGTARIDISHTADDVYYYNLSEPTKRILVTGTSIDVGFGTYRFYQTDGSQKSEEQEVIVDTLKIYSVELSYFTAYITVNYPSYAKCLLTKGTTSINASNGVATVVPSDGVWSVKVYATNTAGEEVIGETSTVTIATDGQSETLTLNGLAKINLTWLSGFDSAITIENSAKGITYNGLLSGTSIIIPVNALGDWIIYGTHTGKQYKAKVTISSFGEEKSVYLKTSTTYAVHISMTEADPDNAVTFPSGYDNSDFSDNAYMDFTGGSFHYGNWADAFFMPRSCMLKFDGTVDYYLNEDDETKKEDGTASDVANMSYGGNAMVEWGKIYFGFKGDADGNGYTFIVSDLPSEGLDCYCNIDENKNEIDHFYTPKYFGSNDSSNRLRSISGQSNYVSQTGTTELSHAKANGNGWSTECYGDWTLIKHLLVLMSKSLNTQAKYGYGRCSGSDGIGQGTMNGKGRFWGDSSKTNGVKIFGMENWYGNLWRRIEGYVTNSSGVQFVKMCYGTRDGSTADAYSTGGTGYVSMGTANSTTGSGIQTMHVNDKCGVAAKVLTGNTSPTTYFSDGYWYRNSCYAYAIVGGDYGSGLLVGAFFSYLSFGVSDTRVYIGAAVSCKPLAV